MFREQTWYSGILIPRELDPKMGTLEDPNEANGPLNMRIPEDIMKGQV